MTAYALAEFDITNAAGMAPYIAAVSDIIAAHGGRYLVRPGVEQVAGNAERVEGGADEYPVKIILEFPSMAIAKAWYHSPEYQEILPYRLANSRGKFVWVEGVE